MSRISIPEEVMNGFAEYGANYFALYDYTGMSLNLGIHCICEKPFNMSMAVDWVDTAKASLLKKLMTISSKSAEIAQIAGHNDLTMIPAGDATYRKYNGVQRQSYNTQVTILNQEYTSSSKPLAKLSTADEVEQFLNLHALPLVKKGAVQQIVHTFFAAPMNVQKSLEGIVEAVKDTEADEWAAPATGAIIYEMENCANNLKNLFSTYKNKLEAAYQKAVINFMVKGLKQGASVKYGGLIFDDKIESGNEAATTAQSKIQLDFQDNSDDAYIQFDKIKDIDILSCKHFGGQIVSLREEFNDAGGSLASKVKTFYKDTWLTGVKLTKYDDYKKVLSAFDIKWNDQIDDSNKNLNLTEVENLIREMTTEFDSIFDKAKRFIQDKLSNDLEKIKKKKSVIEEVGDRIINVTEDFGQFSHRISPCILFFTIGGMIFTEHVLVSSWSQSENVWGFNTSFTINMEKAEIQSWQDYAREIIHVPVS